MDEPLLLHPPGDKLAHLDEVLGCEIQQAEKGGRKAAFNPSADPPVSLPWL